ncbi:hypothetical protein [Aquabacterium humicola]|uniref:hypothetical protein n=1 Tax=Aquabacterium humicola TaxID=3237377 RepID=UPI002543120E|nr:hypothetical protein [Rubrivivax pictus]
MALRPLLLIFCVLLLVLAGVLAWRGERALAGWLGSGAGLALLIVAAFGRRGLNADLPPEAKARWRSLDL